MLNLAAQNSFVAAIITIKDKQFGLYISDEEIQKKIKAIAERISNELKGKSPLFIAVLNGSFMFASDLLKNISIDCEISFVKVTSYHGTNTTGLVRELIGLKEDIKGRTVVVVEDIVDTGITLENIMEQLEKFCPGEIKVATLLHKPEAYTKSIPLDYIVQEVPNDFLVGYGLDYDGFGRNLKDIYKLVETNSVKH